MAEGKDFVKRFKQFKTSKDVLDKIDLDTIRGDKGDTGDTGPEGAQGTTGAKGDPSLVVGPPGMQGGEGLKGDRGATGHTGASGAIGIQGQQGVVGDMPKHELKNGRLRFEKSEGVWGSWINIGEIAHHAAGGAGDARIQAVIDKQPSAAAIPEKLSTSIADFTLSTKFYLTQQVAAAPVSRINVVLQGSGGQSVTWELRKASSLAAAGVVIHTATTTDLTTGDTITSITLPAIVAGDHVWFEFTATAGTLLAFNATVVF